MKKHSLIHAEHITYRYPVSAEEDEQDLPVTEVVPAALDRADLQVEAGQFICILGSNGSGKSTLARHLNALLLPDQGTVWVDGMRTDQENCLWDIRTKVGMVFQNPDNQMVASVVEEEVAFGPENIGVPSGQIRERVSRALQETGMEGFEKEQPYYLSGGQKQRIAIAGILAMNPSCIVLDESTSMLDPQGRQEIMSKVRQLNREKGMTIINITHFMEEAVYADRVIVMHRGRVQMTGSPEEIFRQTEQLQQAGLYPPVVCRLADRLREYGIPVPQDVITEEALTDYLRKQTAK